MKKLVLAIVFALAGVTAASAQVEFRAGPGGLGVGVGPTHERHIRRDRSDDGPRTTVIRRERRDRDMVTGSTGCRTITVKERDDSGRRVTKRIERC